MSHPQNGLKQPFLYSKLAEATIGQKIRNATPLNAFFILASLLSLLAASVIPLYLLGDYGILSSLRANALAKMVLAAIGIFFLASVAALFLKSSVSLAPTDFVIYYQGVASETYLKVNGQRYLLPDKTGRLARRKSFWAFLPWHFKICFLCSFLFILSGLLLFTFN